MTSRVDYRFLLVFTPGFHLIYSSLFFILSIPTSFLLCKFCSALTGNTHYGRRRAPKSADSSIEDFEECGNFYIKT